MNTKTPPKKGLKTRPYNIDMNKRDLKKLSKSQLIKMLMEREEKKPKIIVVDDTKPVPTPRTYKSRPPVPTPHNKVNQFVQFFENKPTTPPRTGKWENVKPKPVPRKSVNKDIIKQSLITTPKPTRKPPPPPNDGFNFYDDIFQTENTSLGKFKIIGLQSRENKKFKSYTNEFKVKILKKIGRC